MKTDLDAALKAQRAAEEEVAELRIRLASAEERSKMFQSRQEEFQKERAEFDDERRTLRLQTEQQWQKFSTAEGETQKSRAETELHRTELARMAAQRAEEMDAMKKEREAWSLREAELQRELLDTQQR